MIVVDTSGLFALFHRREPAHEAAVAAIDEKDELVVSPYVIAELDYLLSTRLGLDEEIAALDELSSGGYELADFEAHDVRAAIEIIQRYPDQAIGLADASLVVLADRYGTKDLLTLDHRHFDVVRPLDGGHFRLLPD